jgi:hypothetical protein
MNTKTIKNKTLGIMLSLALVLSLAAVVLPATPVKATVTSVVINTPNASSPTYVKQGGTVTVNYDLNGDGADASVRIEVYNATNSYLSPYYTRASDNSTYDNDITLPSVVTAGTYNLNVTADGQPDIELGAVIVDNIAPTVTSVSPNGGQYFIGGSSQTISWTATDNNPGSLTLTIDETYDGGALWTNIGAASVSYAQGAKSYTGVWVNAVDSLTAKIRIKAEDAAGNVSAYVASANYFTVINTVPTVAVQVPNGTEVWNGGTNQNITFNANSAYSPTLDYKIQLSTNGGDTYPTDITAWLLNQSKGDRTYAWNPIVNNVRSTNCRIKVQARDLAGNINFDISNANFTIRDVTAPTVSITSPLAAANWYSGSNQKIKWTANDNVPTGNLDYAWYFSTDGGTNWTPISTSTETQGSKEKDWLVPGLPDIVTTSTNCKIKVTATDLATPTTNTGTGLSGTFTITVLTGVPIVAVIAPNTGTESWEVGSTQTISWTASQPGDAAAKLTYTIKLSTDGGGTYPTTIAILTNQPQGSRTFSWAVSDNVSTTCKIQVTATNPLSIEASDASDNNFTITAATCDVNTAYQELPAGWSLISLPLIPTNTSIENVLGPIVDKVLAVWYYTGGASGTWKSYAPGLPSPTLTTMEAGKAYWINLAASGAPHTLVIQGRNGYTCYNEIPPTYSYVAGWNLVGYKSKATKEVQIYLPQIQAQHSQPISGYFDGGGFTRLDDEDMQPWRGYWVRFTGAGPWTASTAGD